MNQILVTEKLYVTPDMKKKKSFFKLEFFLSIFFVVVLSSYGIYAEYDRNKNEGVSQQILDNMTFQELKTITKQITEDEIVVILNNRTAEEVQTIRTIEEELPVPEEQKLIANDGAEYYTLGTIKIPSINVNYPILSNFTDELLKIAPNKFWGPNPNQIRKPMYSGAQL